MEQYITEETDGKSFFFFIPNILNEKELTILKEELNKINDWKITTKFDNITIQRKQKWYQLNNKNFGKEWKVFHDKWQSNSYTEYLLHLQNKIQDYVDKLLVNLPNKEIHKPNINSLLINYYENGNNCIAPHRDDKGSFGLNPTIILLSVGGPRTLSIERTIVDTLKRDKKMSHLNKDFILPDNSLFIMAGESQRYYCHSVKEEPENANERYSLTFREFVY